MDKDITDKHLIEALAFEPIRFSATNECPKCSKKLEQKMDGMKVFNSCSCGFSEEIDYAFTGEEVVSEGCKVRFVTVTKRTTKGG